MLKGYKLKIIFILIFACIILFANKVYAMVEIDNWEDLKSTIETNDSVEIKLKGSNKWEATEEIKINENQNIILISDEEINIIRSKNSTNSSIIENNGSLKISGNIIFDGNSENDNQKGSLIKNINAKIQIENGVIFQNNLCNENGGALYAINSNISMNNITIKDNETKEKGGGIFIESSTMQIRNSKILNNIAGVAGGGIFVEKNNSEVNLDNISVRENQTKEYSGGGIYAFGKLKITGDETVISDNVSYTYGGGIMVKNMAIIENGLIQNNKALTESGGGIRVDGILSLKGGIVSKNFAEKNGGGIDWIAGTLCLYQDNVKENYAKQGGNNINPEYCDESLDWSKDENLKLEKIDVELLKKYERQNDVKDCTLQGMTVAGEYIVFAQIENESENTYINIVDKKTMKILNVVDNYCFSHANALTYNPKENKCYISYYLGNEPYIDSFIIDKDYNVKIIEHIKTDRYYFGLAYNDDTSGFVGVNGQTIYILDENFNELRNFSAKTNLTKQELAYNNGYIYYACWEAGEKTQYQAIGNNRQKFSNVVYVYNYDGTLKKTLYIPNETVYGELEDIYVEKDGNIILAYNTNKWTSISLYKKAIKNTSNDDENNKDNNDSDNKFVDDRENSVNNNGFVDNKDNTISNVKLPKTGNMYIRMFILLSIIGFISISIFIKYRKMLK